MYNLIAKIQQFGSIVADAVMSGEVMGEKIIIFNSNTSEMTWQSSANPIPDGFVKLATIEDAQYKALNELPPDEARKLIETVAQLQIVDFFLHGLEENNG